MNDIQTDRSDEALVTAIRANLCEFFRHLSRSSPSEHFENRQFTRWYMPIQHPWFNGVLSARSPEEMDAVFIEETIQYFRTKAVGAFTWWLEPHLNPLDWESILFEHGFGFSNDTPGMAADLQALKEPIQTSDRLEVHAVEDEESLRKWAHVFTLGYGLPPDWEPSVYNLQLQLGLGNPMQNYLGMLNGEPVSTSSVFLGGGVAGVYSVSTLPVARGRGFGAAMTLQPLHQAREMGYRIGVLQSSEMGFNVYQRLGFRHLCQIENFYLVLR
jgi:ribosomal protein S18 acetylase RimI-like enzyme